MSEFGGLWKCENKPACTRSVKVFIMLKLGTIWKKKSTQPLRSQTVTTWNRSPPFTPCNQTAKWWPQSRTHRIQPTTSSSLFPLDADTGHWGLEPLDAFFFFFLLLFFFFFLDSETKLAANVPKQDPNTQKVKKKTDFNRAAQNQHSFNFLCVWMF